MKVWGRVYFYTLICTALSFALFSRSLPFRSYLVNLQQSRQPSTPATPAIDVKGIEKAAREEVQRERLLRKDSYEGDVSHRGAPTLGLPEDPEAEIDSIVQEVRREIEERKRRGSLVQGFDVKKAVQQKFREFQKKS